MAELNARIIAKASGVSGEAPQSVDLQPAELAVNTADGKLFTKHTDGTIKEIGGGGSSDVESINDLSDVQFDVISSALAYRKGNADNPGEYDQRVLNKTYVYLNQYDANGVDINDVLPAGSYDVYVSDDQGQTWVVNAGSGESGFTSVQLDGGERWLLLGLPTGNSWAPGNSGAELSGDILVSTSAEVTITTLLPDEGDVLRWDDVEEKFRPVPLPEAPAAPVTSVNGETGAVSLGIQDMNDYDLNFIVPTSSGARVNISEYDMDTSDGGWSLSSNLIIDHVNADGVNEYDNSGWVSQLGVGTGLYMTDESGNVFLETIGGYYGVTVELTGPFAPRSYFSLSDDAQTFLSQLPLGAQVTFALGDPLSIVYAPLAEGDILQWNSLDQKFKPAQLSAGGGIEEAPEDGTPYVRQDAGWVSAPSGGGGGGGDSAPPVVTGTFIDSDAAEATTQVLTAPSHDAGDLLVAVIMTRTTGGVVTAPSGFTLYGTYLGDIPLSGGGFQTLSVFTKTATASEPATYTWTQASSSRICGFIAAVEGGASIVSVIENYGNGETATIATVANKLNLTAATWIYADAATGEAYSQSGTGLAEITDSPSVNARISGGYTTAADTVTSTHDADNTSNSPNHGIINIIFERSSSISDLNDVDTRTTPPANGQVLTWVDANNQWEPRDATGGSGGDVESINDLSDVEFDAQSSALVYNAGARENSGEYSQPGNTAYIHLNTIDANGTDISSILPTGNIQVYVSMDDGQTWILNAAGGSYTSVSSSGTYWTLTGLPNGTSWNPSGGALSGRILVSLSEEVTTIILPPNEDDILQWKSGVFKTVPLPSSPVTSVNEETGDVSLGIQDMDDFELNQPAGGDGTWLYRYWSSSGAPSGQFYRNGTTSYFVSYTDSDGGSRRDELLGIQVGDTISFFNINNPAEFTTGSVTGLSSNDFNARVLISTNINSGFFTDDETYAFSSPALGNAKVPAADGDIIQYDSTSSKWRPSRIPAYDGVDGGTFGSG